MGLEKAIKYKKEYRKPYYKSGRFDRTCRPNGSCPYCRHNRFHSIKKEELKTIQQLKEWINNNNEI